MEKQQPNSLETKLKLTVLFGIYMDLKNYLLKKHINLILKMKFQELLIVGLTQV